MPDGRTTFACATLAWLAWHGLFHDPGRTNPFSGPARMPLDVPQAILSSSKAGRALDPRLLQRLSSFDARLVFVRLGPAPLLDCAWCASANDHLGYALLMAAVQYLAVVLVVGILLRGRNRARFVLAGIALASIYDGAVLVGVHVPTGGPPLMFDGLWRFRNVAFFLAIAAATWLTPQDRRAAEAETSSKRLGSALGSCLMLAGQARRDVATASIQRVAVSQDRDLARWAAGAPDTYSNARP